MFDVSAFKCRNINAAIGKADSSHSFGMIWSGSRWLAESCCSQNCVALWNLNLDILSAGASVPSSSIRSRPIISTLLSASITLCWILRFLTGPDDLAIFDQERAVAGHAGHRHGHQMRHVGVMESRYQHSALGRGYHFSSVALPGAMIRLCPLAWPVDFLPSLCAVYEL